MRGGHFSSRRCSRKVFFERGDARFGFRNGELQPLQARTVLTAIFLNLFRQATNRSQLGFRLLQKLVGFFNERIRFVNFGRLFFVFCLRLRNVGAGALDQFRKLTRALGIELDAAAMCGDLAFQSLHYRARVRNFNVDLVQRAAFFRELVFASVDLPTRGVLRFGQSIDFVPARSQLAFQRVELLARIVRI